MDWSTKKFHYKIVNNKGEVIAFIHKNLEGLEKFAVKSEIEIISLERKGPNDFLVRVNPAKSWSV